MKILKKYEEIIRYLIIGGLTTFVSLLTYYVLVYTILDAQVPLELQIANIISWIVSVTFAYFTNRIFVFKTKEAITLKESCEFYLSRLSTLFLDVIMMYLFVSVLGFNDRIIKLLVQIIVIVLNYVLSKFFVFKKK